MNSQKKYINISYIGNKLSKNINYKINRNKKRFKNKSGVINDRIWRTFEMNEYTHAHTIKF